MMLGFQKGTELVAIRVINKQLFFSKLQGGYVKYTPIDGLKLNPSGCIDEFPDLEGKPIEEIRKISLQRFKEHINSLNTPKEIMDYLVGDLEKHGYKLVMYQMNGCRRVLVK